MFYFDLTFKEGRSICILEYFSLVEDNTWIGTESIFKNDVIQNVSVIVGRNGIGKTTLLAKSEYSNIEISMNDGFKDLRKQHKLHPRWLTDSKSRMTAGSCKKQIIESQLDCY